MCHENLTVKNSIIANSTGSSNCSLFVQPSSRGHNLDDDASCFLFTTTDLNAVSAGLDTGGLKNNGGPTKTIALLATSPGVNAIPLTPTINCADVDGNPLTTDQRGVPRPQGSACDIGAYEHYQSRFYQTQAIETLLLMGSVQSLPLPPGKQQGLVAPLKGAVDSLNRGVTNPAINQLGAFINQGNALLLNGALTSEQVNPLITSAQQIIQSFSVPVIVGSTVN